VRSGRRTASSACTQTLNGKRLALWTLLCVSVFVVCTMGGCRVLTILCTVTLNGRRRVFVRFCCVCSWFCVCLCARREGV
jgi:hypothetical protein